MAAAPMSIQGNGGSHPGIGSVAKVLCDEVPKEGVRLQQTGEHHYKAESKILSKSKWKTGH